MSEEPGKFEITQRPEAGALVEVEQQRAIAETQSAMIIAKRFPREETKAIDRIMNACTRPGLAEAALYQYSRGGTDITGPSIRLAETIAQNWGNLQFGIRELDQKGGSSTVEAFAWDVETNVRQVKIFQVAHKRKAHGAFTSLEDPRDIYEMVANQGARRLRACILGIIPGDVTEGAVKQCEATMKTKANVTPERIASLIDKFWEFGVTKAQIEKRIQRHLDAITPALMVNLGKIYNSLKDGMSAPSDWFDVASEQSKATEDLTEKIHAQGKEEAPGPEQGYAIGVKLNVKEDTEVQAKRKRRTKAEMEAARAPEPPPETPPVKQSLTSEEPPPADAPGPVDEETPLFPAKDVTEDDNAFFAEVGDYWAVLPDAEITKILKGFEVKHPADLPKVRRKSFLATCKSRLDKANAGK